MEQDDPFFKDLNGYDNSVYVRLLVIKLAGKALSYAFMKKYENL